MNNMYTDMKRGTYLVRCCGEVFYILQVGDRKHHTWMDGLRSLLVIIFGIHAPTV